ncbi:MAG: hypothetical protein HKN07_10995 [Acidimicrobiia bacterium]|nr:hypothetical protein [Acidimicrobiia bacterium]
MPRLKRFEDFRYVGTRDDMVVYDCDDPEEFGVLSSRVDGERLVDRKLVQVFGPDSLPEARNRGYSKR